MRRTRGWFLLAGFAAAFFGPMTADALQVRECERRIAHVVHDGISFSISISRDGQSLEIVAPEKSGIEPRPISVRLRFRDESALEGSPERQPSIGRGGYTDWHYRFAAKRSLTISSIFSVRISVGDQTFEVMPW